MSWSQWRNPKLYVMLLGDAVCFVLAHAAAYLLRFDFVLTVKSLRHLGTAFLYLVPVKLAVYYAFGSYRGMWRYSSLRDLWKLAQATVVSSLLVAAIMVYLNELRYVTRSVVLLDALLTLVLTGGLRIGIRTAYSLGTGTNLLYGFHLPGLKARRKAGKRVLIVGAGKAGEKILREILDNSRLCCSVVGLLDDDRRKKGRSVHGVPVLGSVKDLSRLVDRFDVQEVLIAIPSATGAMMRRVVEACEKCDVVYKTLPGIEEIMDGRVSIKTLRDVNYEDLLGRETVKLDMSGICEYLTGRMVLITGCGGSIGSELCRQIVRFKPLHLVLVDASEASLFHIQMELNNELHYSSFESVLGSVQDRRLMEEVLRKYRPGVIFHAAAYKHVPMLERNPWEAVSNNIEGSWVMMELAVKYGTERFVLVSTDKAVRPTNVMGASKRITELLLQTFQGNGTRLMAVRFGNVVGSSGSVIPLFRRQIEQGGPVTVTHPDVTRYFMTIPEAARLILQAGAMGEGGEIFILKMGTPVRIAEMAKDLIRLHGKEPGKDIDIVYSGLRDGEKLYEELISADEGIVSTKHDKIMVLKTNGNGHENPVEYGMTVHRRVKELCEIGVSHDGKAIKRKLCEIVPEYMPQESKSVL